MAFRDDVLAACQSSDIPHKKQRLRVGGTHAQRLVDEANELMNALQPDPVLSSLFGIEQKPPPTLTVGSLRKAKNKYLGRVVSIVDEDVLEVF